MAAKTPTTVTIETKVNAPVAKVWELWNKPEHITKWNAASDDWHTPTASNDLKVGGKLKSRMEAKDGSMGFDFEAVYDVVEENNRIEYTLGDGRKVSVTFRPHEDHTHIVEKFDAEETHPVEMQQMGWQAILDNFKKYAESEG